MLMNWVQLIFIMICLNIWRAMMNWRLFYRLTSHQLLHHNAKSFYRSLGTKMVVVPLMLANTMFLPFVPAYLLMKPAAHLSNIGFTRKQEYEADAMGVDLMVKAGYNPLAMESIMGKIAGDGDLAQIFRDHPVGTDRIANIHKIIVEKYPQFLDTTISTKADLVKDSKADLNIKPINNTGK